MCLCRGCFWWCQELQQTRVLHRLAIDEIKRSLASERAQSVRLQRQNEELVSEIAAQQSQQDEIKKQQELLQARLARQQHPAMYFSPAPRSSNSNTNTNTTNNHMKASMTSPLNVAASPVPYSAPASASGQGGNGNNSASSFKSAFLQLKQAHSDHGTGTGTGTGTGIAGDDESDADIDDFFMSPLLSSGEEDDGIDTKNGIGNGNGNGHNHSKKKNLKKNRNGLQHPAQTTAATTTTPLPRADLGRNGNGESPTVALEKYEEVWKRPWMDVFLLNPTPFLPACLPSPLFPTVLLPNLMLLLRPAHARMSTDHTKRRE